MSEFVYNPDIAGRTARLVPSVYRDAERIQALFASVAETAQHFEDASYGVLVSDAPETAWGNVLDRWGRVVGQGRGGLTDDEYRTFVEARQIANRAGSNIDDLLQVWQLITAPGEHRHFRLPPAGFSLLVWRSRPMRPSYARRVVALMDDIRPAGVEMTLIEAGDKDAAYRYDDGPGLDNGAFARALT